LTLTVFSARPSRPSRSPVFYRMADGVAAGRALDPGLDVAVKLGEFAFDLLLGAAGHLTPDPLAFWAVAQRHRTPPPARASLVVPRITAVAGVVEVDRVLAETAPAHAGSVTLWLPAWLPDDLREITLCL
jgi:hypothetical protein